MKVGMEKQEVMVEMKGKAARWKPSITCMQVATYRRQLFPPNFMDLAVYHSVARITFLFAESFHNLVPQQPTILFLIIKIQSNLGWLCRLTSRRG